MIPTREPSSDSPEFAATQDTREGRTRPRHRPSSSFEHRRAVASARRALFGQGPELCIGRYRVRERLGAGGMGEVYLAQDTRLERLVAIKRVLGVSNNERDQERLRREAKALARLSHPNVVQVYESGEHEERTFLAMEYVQGSTLAAWLEEERPWREILARFVDAGRGLAAAHSAGIVHRDFKAENVLLDQDGRARVADFGLAIDALTELEDRGDEDPEPGEPSASVSGSASVSASASASASGPRPAPSLGERMSVTGALVGTIRYMAPEQIRAGHIDARSDQFAYCVSLYEALYAIPPFPLDSVAARVEALNKDAPTLPESRHPGPPQAIWRALRRGMALDPDQRWPSLDALLAELEAIPRQRRRRRLTAGIGVALAATLALVASASATVDPCAGIEDELAGVWDSEQRERTAPSFERSEERDLALDALDDWAAGWLGQRRAVCEATGRSSSDVAVEHEKLACLTRQRQRVDALLDEFQPEGQALDDPTAARALEVLRQLPAAEVCDDDLGILMREPPPRAQRETIAALQGLLDRAHDQRILGDVDRGREALREAEHGAQSVAYGPLQAEVQAEVAKYERATGSLDRAVPLYRDAIDSAERSRHEALAGELWLSLALVSFNELDDPQAGARQLRRASVTWQRLQAEDRPAARLAFARALEAEAAGEVAVATTRLREAIAIAEADEPPNPDLPSYRAALARLSQDDPAAQLALMRQTVRDAETIWGAEHPQTAPFQFELGNALNLRGELAQAQALLEAALANWSRVDEGASQRAAGLLTLAQLAIANGDLGEAKGHARALATLRAELLPADHADHGDAPQLLAIIAGIEGEHELAIDHAREALRYWEPKLAPNAAEVLYMRTEIATHAFSLGRVDEAALAYEAVLAHAPRYTGLVRVTAHLGLCELELSRGHTAAAAAQLSAIDSLALPSLGGQAFTFALLRAVVTMRQELPATIPLEALTEASRETPLQTAQIDAWLLELPLEDDERARLTQAIQAAR